MVDTNLPPRTEVSDERDGDLHQYRRDRDRRDPLGASPEGAQLGNGDSTSARPVAGPGGAPDIVPLRHGVTDQKAPQAHAQEEAQEAAEEDPLAASSAGSVALASQPIRTPRDTLDAGVTGTRSFRDTRCA